MEYSEFMRKMRSVFSTHDKGFTCIDHQLFWNMVSKDYPEIRKLTKKAERTYKSYRSNNNQICKLAHDISKYISISEFSNFLMSVDQRTKNNLCPEEELQEKLEEIFQYKKHKAEAANAFDLCARIFWGIISDAAAEYRNPKNVSESNVPAPQNKNKKDNSSGTSGDCAKKFMYPTMDFFHESPDETMFIKTEKYKEALNTLKDKHCVFIIGGPGSGKSFSSKMILTEMQKEGFNPIVIPYMSSIQSVCDALQEYPEEKDVILVDDILGQAYYNLTTDQGNSLKSLISMIRYMPEKRLILNSRITSFLGTWQHATLSKALQKLSDTNAVISFDETSMIEKALILDIHITRSQLPDLLKKSICNYKDRYMKILQEPNYCPRFVNHIVQPFFYNGCNADDYWEKVWSTLTKSPELIWEDEYNKKLAQRDRLLLIALYSLTDSSIPLDICERAYQKLIYTDPDIDNTVNNWEQALKLLNGSMVKLSLEGRYYDKRQRISVINPSVNDYLRKKIVTKGSAASHLIKENVFHFFQIDRSTEYITSDELEKRTLNRTILDLEFENMDQRTTIIAYFVAASGICEPDYKLIINDYLSNKYKNQRFWESQSKISSDKVYEAILKNPSITSYYIGPIFPAEFFSAFIHRLSVYALLKVLSETEKENPGFILFPNIKDGLIEAVENELSNFSNVSDLAFDELYDTEWSDADKETANEACIDYVEKTIKVELEQEIESNCKYLPLYIKKSIQKEISSFQPDFTEDIEQYYEENIRDRESEDYNPDMMRFTTRHSDNNFNPHMIDFIFKEHRLPKDNKELLVSYLSQSDE